MEIPREELIFDRTNTDVQNARNNPNNLSSNKGNYNISDLSHQMRITLILYLQGKFP